MALQPGKFFNSTLTKKNKKNVSTAEEEIIMVPVKNTTTFVAF